MQVERPHVVTFQSYAGVLQFGSCISNSMNAQKSTIHMDLLSRCYAWAAATSFRELREDLSDVVECVTLSQTLMRHTLFRATKATVCAAMASGRRPDRRQPSAPTAASCASCAALYNMQQGMLTDGKCLSVAADGTTEHFVYITVCRLPVLAVNAFMVTRQKAAMLQNLPDWPHRPGQGLACARSR